MPSRRAGKRSGCPRTVRGPRADTVRTAPCPLSLVLVCPGPIASGLFRETGGCTVAKRFPPKTALALIAASLLAGPALVPAQAADAPAAQAQKIPVLKYQRFTLPNGLTVVVHEDHKAPVVAVSVWYHVGSSYEPNGKTGFAHLFEHLMFQGSENHKDEYFKPFELAGATDQNGTTWLDRTNYFETVPTTALDMALWMESDRMGHLLGAIGQKELDEQRGVVQNEKRQDETAPYGRVSELIQAEAFPGNHPYHHDTIGSMADLNAASLADVKKGADPAKGEAAAADEWAKFLKDGPTADELERVKTGIRAAFVRGLERVNTQASILAEGQLYQGDPGAYLKDFDTLMAATPASVQASANHWIAKGDYTVTVTPGKVEETDFATYAGRPAQTGKPMDELAAKGEYTTVKSTVDRSKCVPE